MQKIMDGVWKSASRVHIMKTYEFELKFSLPKTSQNPDFFVERLAETGCTDALVGIGQTGRIAFHFARDANSAFEAVLSAVNNIKKNNSGSNIDRSRARSRWLV